MYFFRLALHVFCSNVFVSYMYIHISKVVYVYDLQALSKIYCIAVQVF